MKRAVSAGLHGDARDDVRTLAKESALGLLARSITFGHSRLAVIRLAMAVKAGADIPAAHWDYCRAAAAGARDTVLKTVFAEAADATRVAH
jgi:hypothetical protein